MTKTWRLPLRNLSLGQQQNKTEFALDRRSSSGLFKIYHLYLCLCICVCVCSYLLRFLYGHSPRFSLSPSKIESIVFFVGFSVLLFFNLVVKLSHREDSGFSQSQRIKLWQNIPPPDKSLSPFSVVPPLLPSLSPIKDVIKGGLLPFSVASVQLLTEDSSRQWAEANSEHRI